MDYSLITNIVFDGIDHSDYPDYSDAYIVEADYDGVPMTYDQLDTLNNDFEFVYNRLIEHLT